jgi:hypothetical protein
MNPIRPGRVLPPFAGVDTPMDEFPYIQRDHTGICGIRNSKKLGKIGENQMPGSMVPPAGEGTSALPADG